MLWGKRYKRRVYVPVAGLLLALFWLELTHVFITPNLIPSWFAQAQAATAFIDPTTPDAGTNNATRVTCPGTGFFECIDDGTRSPTIPANTTGDFIEYAGGTQSESNMTNIAGVSVATQVAVNLFHQVTDARMQLSISLVNAAGTVIAGPTAAAQPLTAAWDTVTFAGLNLTQATLDGLRVRMSCTRSGGPGSNRCNVYTMNANVTYDPVINVTVAAVGSQQNIDAGTNNAYIGGTFRIAGTVGTRDVTSIIINETGTIDALNNLKNIKLFYDLDTTTLDCSSQSYGGAEPQFGSTVAGGFSAANGSATFSPGTGVTISPTQTMCVYVVVDVQAGANPGDTIEVQITNPTTDVVATGSPVISPATAVLLPGTTVVERIIRNQYGYHWRNDDGSETTASSATGAENTPLPTMSKGTTERVRIALENDGNKTTTATQYRLEYAQKVTTCDVASGWTDVGAAGGDFDMSPTINLTDGADTTNILVATGGVSDPGGKTFLSPNGGQRDTTSQTGSLTLTATQFVDLEYAIVADAGITDGTTFCFRVTDAGTPLESYAVYPEATLAADVLVGTIGNQIAVVTIPTTQAYGGGAFVITDSVAGGSTISQVTLTVGGTVDVLADISNLRLRYDLDTTTLDCSSQSYSGGDTQYGTTVTSVNGSNQAVFSQSLTVSSTQTLCLYVEYDVGSGATNGETATFSIADPSTEVVAGGASVAPAAPVTFADATVLASDSTSQVNYHWRNNDGGETDATSATGGTENTVLEDLSKETSQHLRIAVANTGLASTSPHEFRLEWAQRLSTCSNAVGWERIDTTLDAWEIAPTVNLTDGSDTTNVIVSNGGVSDPATNFVSPNGGVKATSDTTAARILPADSFIELEYSIRATTDAVQGATYCFRVTNAGTELDTYTRYPQATIKLDTDFKIQRGVFTMTGDTFVLNTYDPPSSAANAFIRITNTAHTGAGPNTGNANNNARDVTVYVSNPANIVSSVTFTRGPTATGNTRVSWEIVEYTGAPGGENEMIVRQQAAITYGAAAATVNGAAVGTVVDNADVVVFITGQHNPDNGRNSYNNGLSTAAWNGSTVTLTRGGTGTAVNTSYALVEFTGSNWKIQRVEHTYTAVNSFETEPIALVNSLTRAFLHTQKRTTSNNHADFGHEVWLTGLTQLTFFLDPDASTPAGHTSVAWVIENTQTAGARMRVTPSFGTLAAAATGPQTNTISIGRTLEDVTIASLFVNNRSNEAQRSYPEPILGARIVSPTQYELWRSDVTATLNYRTEVVEWPTAARKLQQNFFRLYEDNNLLTPTTPWSGLGENAEMTVDDDPLASGDTIRIRMTMLVDSAAQPSTLDSYVLEYAERVTTCSAVSAWSRLGDIGSTTAAWRGVDRAPTSGTALSTNPPTGGDLLLSVSNVAGTFEEQNPTALNPYTALPTDDVEYDWVVQHNTAKDKTSYCFRMIEAGGTEFEAYNFYPVLRTVGYGPELTSWRWYDDDTNLTPTVPRAAENVAPIDIENQNILKLRLVLRESQGASGIDTKFLLEFSEYSDFSESFPVLSQAACLENSLWCYADGAGNDNDIISAAVLADADACVAGVGLGCGTYNEATSTPSTFDHAARSSAEFEFTVRHAGARANAVYYFRLFDTVNDEYVPLGATSSVPSLVTEGAQLVLQVDGLPAGTTTAGVVTDVTTTPGGLEFGIIPLNTDYTAAHRLSVNTNATEGYQVIMYARQQLLNSYGDSISPITTSNIAPDAWSAGCVTSAVTSCIGYHTTDAVLRGGSARFAPLDSYAGLATVPEEIMYSSIPINDVQDIVYRVWVGESHPAGDYESEIVYIAIPAF